MSSTKKRRQLLAHMVKENNLDAVTSMIKENPEACQGISSVRKGDSALHLAARLGLSDMVKLLLDHIAVNSTNNDGKTALHEAASAGHCEIVNLLLRNGAEVNCLKAADWTPLMMACAKSHLQVVEILVTAGASLSNINKDGWTAFHIAAREGDVHVLALLLRTDKNCWNTLSKNNRSPLHSAGYVNIASLLLDHGASFHTNNSLGRSCFHVVAEAGEVTSLNFLCGAVEDGAGCLNMVDDRGSTPLHLAAKEGHGAMVEALAKAGANMNLLDSMGRTALDIARICGKVKCAEVLEQLASQS